MRPRLFPHLFMRLPCPGVLGEEETDEAPPL